MGTRSSFCIIFAALLVTAGGCTSEKTGILIMAHGGDAAWNQNVEKAVDPLRKTREVEIAYGMARPSTLQAAVNRLESRGVRRIAVVRMFISADSFRQRTEGILGLRPIPPGKNHHAASPHVTPVAHVMAKPAPITSESQFILSPNGVGESPLVDEILMDRVRSLSTDPSTESVLILAHGPGDEAENERWLANMRLRSQRIHEIGPFRHVQCETLREDWPTRRHQATQRIRSYVEEGNKNHGRVIVVPFRISGFGPYREVLKGLKYVADGRGFCPHPNMTRWIAETAEQCLNPGASANHEKLQQNMRASL